MTESDLLGLPSYGGRVTESNGTLIMRVIWHYWYHIGEGQAIRQVLGHTDLPVFSSLDVPALVLSALALVAVLRFQAGMVATLAACAVAGTVLWILGLI